MTIAQDWARERNFAKKRLMGITASCQGLIHTRTLLKEEKREIAQAQRNIDFVISLWDRQNKQSKEEFKKRGGDS